MLVRLRTSGALQASWFPLFAMEIVPVAEIAMPLPLATSWLEVTSGMVKSATTQPEGRRVTLTRWMTPHGLVASRGVVHGEGHG